MGFDPSKVNGAAGVELPLEWDPPAHAVIGATIEVHNHLGPGLRERFHERAMTCELRQRGLRLGQQVPFRVHFKGEDLGTRSIDLIVNDLVIVENKSVTESTDIDEAQLLGYLRFTGLRPGFFISFNKPKLVDKVVRRVDHPCPVRSPSLRIDLAPCCASSVPPL
jgi:GxxExxY protein